MSLLDEDELRQYLEHGLDGFGGEVSLNHRERVPARMSHDAQVWA